ncbi:MAG: O-antigen ligase family protein [Kiritimatiellae bacterium]|nr:O-antigen ligase family protein [Kiritimatiellia bacterium]
MERTKKTRAGAEDRIPEVASYGFCSALASWLHLAGFSAAAFVAVASPWFFSAWEMWWFWSMSAVLCVALICSGAATVLDEAVLRPSGLLEPHHRHVPTRAVVLLALCVPFLAYAALRGGFPSGAGSPLVAMERERSLMLFFTPIALALVHLLSSRTRWRAVLLRILLWNFVLVCICAVATHFANNDTQILWVAANDFTYVGRASAPFYCPNHFVDFAAFGFFAMLSVALTPRVKLRTFLPVVAGAAFCAISAFLSLSRGGVAAMFAAFAVGVPALAFLPRRRWVALVAGPVAVLAIAGGIAAVRYTDNPLMDRVVHHSLWKTFENAESFEDFSKEFSDVFWYKFDRGQYIGSALRAWKSNPVWGIGPGQHSNRWAQFEASSDGVRPTLPDLSDMVRPRHAGYEKHLYEVHSDWTQLLEEYGIVGVVLFLVPAVGLMVVLVRRIRPCAAGDARSIDRSVALAASMCFLMLCFHCAFDFSLQIPAITWLFATLCSLAVLSEGEAA